MAASETMTFDLAAPRRPTADDVDATLVNDGDPGVLGTGMPYDWQLNQALALCAAYGRMLPVLSIEVHFAAGTPSVYAVQALRSTLVAGDITVTDNGAGDVTLTWAADTLPVAASSPEATMVEDGPWLVPVATAVANGVRVKTIVDGNVLTDGNFKVHVH